MVAEWRNKTGLTQAQLVGGTEQGHAAILKLHDDCIDGLGPSERIPNMLRRDASLAIS
jgi:hypothetical protein